MIDVIVGPTPRGRGRFAVGRLEVRHKSTVVPTSPITRVWAITFA